MDNRLEKIRHFQASVLDFESYIKDRIKQTHAENEKNDKINESDTSYSFTKKLIKTIEDVIGKGLNIEFGQDYPLDPQDVPDFDTRPYVNTVYEYNIQNGIIAKLYMSDTNYSPKYISFSYIDVSFDPLTKNTSDEYDIILPIDVLKNSNKAHTRNSLLRFANEYEKEYDRKQEEYREDGYAINRLNNKRGYAWVSREHAKELSQKYPRNKQIINRIKQLDHNIKLICKKYNFTPTTNIPQDCIDYIVGHIYDFDEKYSKALDKMNQKKCSLFDADHWLYNDIVNYIMKWRKNNGIQDENIEDEYIEEVFG